MRAIITLFLGVLLLAGCAQSRTESTQTQTKDQNTEKVENINETYDVNLQVGPYPITGSFTRVTKKNASEVTKEEANAKATAVTTLEMPPEFKAMMAVLTKLAANFAAPGIGGAAVQAGESFLSRLGSSVTSDTGLTTISAGAAGAGTLGVMYRNRVRRKREELEQQKDEEADEMLSQIVEALEKFFKDDKVAQDCKDLLMAELSKSLDKETKARLMTQGLKVV